MSRALGWPCAEDEEMHGRFGALIALCSVSLGITAAIPATTVADPVIAAAGDIACSPADRDFNGGSGTSDDCRQRHTSDLLVAAGLSAVLPLGDVQYETGSLAEFLGSYDPSWARVKSITHPVVGNHEYRSEDAHGYFDYFDGTGNSTGPAGDRDKGYYSYDIGTWHLVALNTNASDCSYVACADGSPQEQWLRADLAAHPAACTLAYWHHPLFNSGQEGSALYTDAFWRDLYHARADIVLNGHAHDYERFAPQDPNGNADPLNGIREFIVGTGGYGFTTFQSSQPNSEVFQNNTFGVLELTLHPSSYEWRFVPEEGETFTDSGSGMCHRGLLPAAPPPSQPTTMPLPPATPAKARCRVPKVRGMSLRRAKRKLRRARCRYRARGHGRVVSVRPRAGTRTRRTVRLRAKPKRHRTRAS